VINISTALSLNSSQPTVVVLVAIRNCLVDAFNSLGTKYYSKLGPLEIIDLVCVQCLIGRVWASHRWAIIDRSGRAPQIAFEESDKE
jgi:hypothetical protein